MAQLSDDCFAGADRLLAADEALAMLAERIPVAAGVERVALRETGDRILAEDVISPVDVPPHANAAVDGYAVRFADLDPDNPTKLPVVGRAAAGHPLEEPAQPGTAVRIFTGAPMPEGPDTVMMQEDCSERDGIVTVAPGIAASANRRLAGEDVHTGDCVLRAGIRLRPQDVGMAAAVGKAELMVYRRLAVTVFSTGDEVSDPGGTLGPGMIYDSNRHALVAALDRLGCAVHDLGILADDPDAIANAVAKATRTSDALITTGGMSVGEEDHVKSVIERDGHIHFWRLAIKPGRPVAFGQVRSKEGWMPVLGLPGNPVAALVTFALVGRPFILRLAGAADPSPTAYRVRAGFSHRKKANRREYVRVRIERDADGVLTAHKHGASGAGILSSLVGADGLVELSEKVTVLDAGMMVDVLPFSEVML